MATMVTQGIVLRYTNYREYDRILSLLTPDHGVMDVLARGCRRPKSHLLPACEWFVCGEYVLFQGAERSTLTSCVLQDTFYPLRLDMYRLTCASYMAALCNAGVLPEQESTGLYALLMKGLYCLAYDAGVDGLTAVNQFLLLFADYAGYRPRLSRCIHCREPLDLTGNGLLDIEAGGLCCPDCASRTVVTLTHDQVVWLSQTLRNGFSAQENTGDKALFYALRRYVESRLDMPVRAGKLLP